jgi:hypothetical protein
LNRRLVEPFEDNEFISLNGSGISKEPNSRLFNDNLFLSCVEEGNISGPHMVTLFDAARLEH